MTKTDAHHPRWHKHRCKWYSRRFCPCCMTRDCNWYHWEIAYYISRLKVSRQTIFWLVQQPEPPLQHQWLHVKLYMQVVWLFFTLTPMCNQTNQHSQETWTPHIHYSSMFDWASSRYTGVGTNFACRSVVPKCMKASKNLWCTSCKMAVFSSMSSKVQSQLSKVMQQSKNQELNR